MLSLRSLLIQLLIRGIQPKGRIHTKSIEEIRVALEFLTRGLRLPRNTEIISTVMGGVSGEWVVPPKVSSNRVLFYIHGGGYIAGSCKTHRAIVARFAKALCAKAFHIDYRLAPEHPFSASVEDCFTVYKALIQSGIDPKCMIIAGESAGGALALATLIQARDHNVPLPGAMFSFSPHTDFTMKSASITTCQNTELFFTRDDLEWVRGLYLKNHDPADPLCSPIYANLRGLPPLLIHTTHSEMLRDDAIRLAARAKEVGVKVELKIWPELFHAFQLIPFLPESKLALKETAAFVDRYLPNLY